jgi:pyruvate formate lyase activating enzyme
MNDQNIHNYKRAVLWDTEGDKVRCNLCRHQCLIADGKTGICKVRQNIDGTLYSLVYDKVCSAGIDPIEKKPLFHFQPASSTFSIATPGCNFRCEFCQNWQISQQDSDSDKIDGQPYSPKDIVNSAKQNGCRSIAYTYTEPTIFMELASDTGQLAKKEGLANVFVSNGYETIEAVDFAKGWLDGINIDLKSFSEDFYKNLCGAKLAPVLDTISYIAGKTDIWMEITTLIVPGQNDSDDELKQIAGFIANFTGVDTPWHISRFYPNYRMDDTDATAQQTLQRALQIGKDAGLRYIYIGNMPGAKAESTFCYKCGREVIQRIGYTIGDNVITNGACPDCGAKIAGFNL